MHNSTLLLTLALGIFVSACSPNNHSSSEPNNAPTESSVAKKSRSLHSQTPIDYSLLNDQALANCVKQADVQYAEQVQILKCQDRSIESIKGLEQFSDLRVLNVSGNSIRSISPLSELEHLSYINVSRNQIFNIEPLSKLNNMTFLSISSNHIMKIDALSDKATLRRLYADNNNIVSFDSLGTLKNLNHFTASVNPAPFPNNLPNALKTYKI